MTLKKITLFAVANFLLSNCGAAFAYYIPPDSIYCERDRIYQIRCTNVETDWVEAAGWQNDVDENGEWFYFQSAKAEYAGYPRLSWVVNYKFVNSKNTSHVFLSSISENIEPDYSPGSDWSGDTCTNRIGCRIKQKKSYR